MQVLLPGVVTGPGHQILKDLVQSLGVSSTPGSTGA